MLNKTLKKFETVKKVRRYRKVAAYAVLGLFIGALFVGRIIYVANNQTTSELPQTIVENEQSEEITKSLPVFIRIPSAGIEATFGEPLGVKSNNEIEVPDSFEEVGYYKYGPTPGELGPAVVLGHVDSKNGPAVFWSLGEVKVGETIEIDREDGATAVFEVESIERHEQSGFPTEKVYSDLDYEGLRVITCSGIFDHGVQRYSHNLIVFAKLVEIRQNN